MKQTHFVAITLLSVLLAACDNDDTLDIKSPRVIDFNGGANEFSAIFSDYPQGEESFYELEASHTSLPEDFNTRKGWMLSGNNHSDDLLMAIKGKVSGLASQTLYKISIEAEILTNVPSNCFGIGGAPGESVFVKLGGSTQEPVNQLDNGMYRLNIDIGQQSNSGTHGLMVGDVANGVECGEDEVYKQKVLKTETPIDVMSDDKGALWVIAATDSGYEGKTTVYFNKLTVTISE